jgi:hypothetical protein
MSEPERSEFGTGYATCLRQFANHRVRLEEMTKETVPEDLFSMAALWANGASDHLFDMKTPKSLPLVQKRAAKALREVMIDAGHGFGERTRDAKKLDMLAQLDIADKLLELIERQGHEVRTLDQCMAYDRFVGLNPDVGRISCREDRRKGG